MTEPATPETELDSLYLQHLQQVDRAENPNPSQLRPDSEHLTGELLELVETAQWIEDLAGPPTSDASKLTTAADTDAISPDPDGNSDPAQTTGGLEGDPDQTGTWKGDDAQSQGAVGETELGAETMVSSVDWKSSAPENASGTQLGDYEILDELGRGGMGVVYKARQVTLGRNVALKMIRSGALASEIDVQRFHLEAQAAGRLSHPAIVQVYQVGELGGDHFFSMEYIEGETLSQYAQTNALTPTDTAQLVKQIAEAIHFAHEHGVLHRDLKPSNIMLDADRNPRITDFGLAKDMNSEDQLTSTGSALGTPSYMPPEQAQARRDDITARSDIYSLGAILYSLIAGRPPFRAKSLVGLLMMVIHDEPTPPRDHNANCPRDLEAICLKCLQKDPEDRYATAQELADDLTRFLNGERVNARRSRWYDRAWNWTRNVPVVAAAIGRRTATPTIWHWLCQWLGIVAVFAALFLWLWLPSFIESRRISVVDISTGQEGGSYDRIGSVLAESFREVSDRVTQVHQSAGTIQSRERLMSAEVDISFIQENALDDDNLKVVAPLYREAVLVIVRKNLPIAKFADLKGQHISLGPPGSGMRLSSNRLLKYHDVASEECLSTDLPYTDLSKRPSLSGAIVTIKIDDSTLHEVLNQGDYRLLSVPDANDIPGFRAMLLKKNDLPLGVITSESELIPATFAVLAVRSAAPDHFVNDLLESLYQGSVQEKFDDVISRSAAAAWTDLNYHPAARAYFQRSR